MSQIIARVSVDNRTRALVQALHRASDVKVYINRVEDLSYHLLEFPETRGVAVKVRNVAVCGEVWSVAQLQGRGGAVGLWGSARGD